MGTDAARPLPNKLGLQSFAAIVVFVFIVTIVAIAAAFGIAAHCN